MADRPEGSRLRAYIEHNREAILRDVSVALLWTGTIAFMIDQMDWPLWSFFLIYFGIWFIYLQVVPPWELPHQNDAADDSGSG